MARRSASTRSAPAGAWKPRVFFWLLIAALLLLGGAEIFNAFRRPALLFFKGPGEFHRLVLYQKGRAGSREAWLLTEPQGDSGPPRCFQRIDCTDADKFTGGLRWSYDGKTLYATRRRPQSMDAGDRPLWVYEFETNKLWSVSDAPGAGTFPLLPATERTLVDLINRHGGKGPAVVSWYDLGKHGEHLFAWQLTRWENALPSARAKQGD